MLAFSHLVSSTFLQRLRNSPLPPTLQLATGVEVPRSRDASSFAVRVRLQSATVLLLQPSGLLQQSAPLLPNRRVLGIGTPLPVVTDALPAPTGG